MSFGSLATVGQLGHRGLHPKCHLVLAMRVWISGSSDPRPECRSAVDLVDRLAAACSGRRRRGCRRNARHRPSTGIGCPGICSGRKPADHCRAETGCSPDLPADVRTMKPGKFVGLGPQAVEQPRAHARPALDDRAGVHEGVGRVVIDLLGLHRADDAEVVGDRRRCAGTGSRSPGPTCRICWKSQNGPRALSTAPCNCASCCPLVNDSGNGWPLSFFSSGL